MEINEGERHLVYENGKSIPIYSNYVFTIEVDGNIEATIEILSVKARDTIDEIQP